MKQPRHGQPQRQTTARAAGQNDNRREPPMTLVNGPPEAVTAYLEWWNGMTREERWKEYESWQDPLPDVPEN